MYTYNERMEELEKVHNQLKDVIDKYTDSQHEYVAALWKSIFALHGILHEYCNSIEAGTFDTTTFYNEVSDMLGRPKDL